MSLLERLRNVSVSSVLLHGVAAGPRGGYPPATKRPETTDYVDARAEARDLCRNLGLDVDNEHYDQAAVADFLRLAYAEGWKACESKVNGPDAADAIAIAIDTPELVVDVLFPGEKPGAHVVRAVQRAVVYGVPKGAA